MKLAYPWSEYYALQQMLKKYPDNSDTYWGIENALTKFVDSLEYGTLEKDRKLLMAKNKRAVASASRRERDRAHSRRNNIVDEFRPSPENQLIARWQLLQIQKRLREAEWLLITLHFSGYTYQEISLKLGIKPGTIRAQYSRLVGRIRNGC